MPKGHAVSKESENLKTKILFNLIDDTQNPKCFRSVLWLRLSGDCRPLSLINVRFASGLVLRKIQTEGAIVTWFTSSHTAVSVPTLWVLLWDI